MRREGKEGLLKIVEIKLKLEILRSMRNNKFIHRFVGTNERCN